MEPKMRNRKNELFIELKTKAAPDTLRAMRAFTAEIFAERQMAVLTAPSEELEKARGMALGVQELLWELDKLLK